MEFMVVVTLGLLTIAAVTVVGDRLGVAAPLLLVVVGGVTSLAPAMPAVVVRPEWVLAGVLPPLLYSAAVSMPAMDFRREFGAVSGLSVVLVVATALVLGVFFTWALPGLGLAWGVALGAVLSPTDAVATSIVKRLGVSARVVTLLEGEGLLNDASALIVLRAAVAATAASISFRGVLADFVTGVVVATAVGAVVGRLGLLARSRIRDAHVSTLISLSVPLVASLPAEGLGVSGLVAAVAAGLVTGHHAPRLLPPAHRLTDAENWRTVELVLEGAIFLGMGLQVDGLATQVDGGRHGLGVVLPVAAGALALTVAVRGCYVTPLLAALHRTAARSERVKARIVELQAQLTDADAGLVPVPVRRGGPGRVPSPRRVDQLRRRLRRGLADVDYFLAAPLGPRDGVIVVWAGMRGAVTVAAAQTLPEDTPHRPLLILVAFAAAGMSLLVQGGSLPLVVRRLRGPADPGAAPHGVDPDERARLAALLQEAAAAVPPGGVGSGASLTLARITAQRQALLDARDDGTYSAAVLTAALAVLDADQISLELKGAPA